MSHADRGLLRLELDGLVPTPLSARVAWEITGTWGSSGQNVSFEDHTLVASQAEVG